MRSPPIQSTGYGQQQSLRSRAAAFVLSLGVIALLILALLSMGALPNLPGGPGERLTAVQLSSDSAARKQQARKQQTEQARPKAAVVNLPQPVPVPVPVPTTPPVQIIKLSRSDFAASDISKLPRHPAEEAGSGDTAQGSSAAYGPGEGPGGARLYRAEWYREPTDAEMAGYFKNGAPPGSWATIACQTIDHYHVENCQQLDESPPGSGLSRALRQAAWQFLVRPPRINGKPIPGAWVRIRFDFTRRPAKVESAAVRDEE